MTSKKRLFTRLFCLNIIITCQTIYGQSSKNLYLNSGKVSEKQVAVIETAPQQQEKKDEEKTQIIQLFAEQANNHILG